MVCRVTFSNTKYNAKRFHKWDEHTLAAEPNLQDTGQRRGGCVQSVTIDIVNVLFIIVTQEEMERWNRPTVVLQ